jgi:hypothetical protein
MFPGFGGLLDKAVQPVGENHLRGQEPFMLVVEPDVIFNEERHQAFHAIQAGLA